MSTNRKNLILSVIILGSIVLLVVVYSLFVQSKIKSSEAYRKSMEYMKDNEELKKSIGEVKGFSDNVTGSIEQYKKEGRARLEYSVHGSKKDAPIKIDMVKDSTGLWKVKDFKIIE